MVILIVYKLCLMTSYSGSFFSGCTPEDLKTDQNERRQVLERLEEIVGEHVTLSVLAMNIDGLLMTYQIVNSYFRDTDSDRA